MNKFLLDLQTNARSASPLRLFWLSLSLLACVSLLGAQDDGQGDDDSSYIITDWGEEESVEEVAFDVHLEKVAQSKTLELYFDSKTSVLAVREKGSGMYWYSSPLDWETDQVSAGTNKLAIPSLLCLKNYDRIGTPQPVNSWSNVVKQNRSDVPTFTHEAIEGGIRVVYTFTREGMVIPMEFSIDDNGSFLARIVLSEILEAQDIDPDSGMMSDSASPATALRLGQLSLLPFFGAAGAQEQGYMLVPDGSGAIIRFSNRKGLNPYQQPVYGRDPSIPQITKRSQVENSLLPVFGMSRSAGGFLAVLESGAARSAINAEAAYLKSSYNAIGTTYTLREATVVSVAERTYTNRLIRIFEKKPDFEGEYSIRYLFLGPILGGKDFGYSAMAKAYRQYLVDRGQLKPSPLNDRSRMEISFFGCGKKTKPVLGIPAKVVVPYTTFKDAQGILENLEGLGCPDLSVRYSSWIKGGDRDAYPGKPKAEPKLGGSRGLRKFLSSLKNKGIPGFLTIDPVNLFQSSIRHFSELEAARSLDRSTAKQFLYRLSTFEKHPDYPRTWYLLKPSLVEKGFSRMIGGFKAFPDAGLAPDSLGAVIYTDYNPSAAVSRNKVADRWASLIAKAGEQSPLSFDRPNAYALPMASSLSRLPMESSRFDVEDESVPFYQMVVHGYLPYTLQPGNQTTDQTAWRLKLLEYGANPAYLFVGRNSIQLRETTFEDMYSVVAEDWINDAAQTYKELKPILDQVARSQIAEHRILGPQLRLTRYENGLSVYVNYSEVDSRLPDGRVVSARSYLVDKGKSE